MVGEEGSGERASVRGDEQEFGTKNAPVWDNTGRTREMVSIIFMGTHVLVACFSHSYGFVLI